MMHNSIHRLALTAIVSLTALIPFVRGISRSYIEHSDPDIVFAYQGLQLNDGDTNINAEHTGYVYFVLLSILFRIARVVGFIDIDRTTPLLQLEPEAFDVVYANFIFLGRGLSILLAGILVLVMFTVGRLVTRTVGGGFIAAVLVAASWGTATQALILRTEILSSIFVMSTFAALVAAARATDPRNAFLLFAAGLTSVLAVATKLQAIAPLMCVACLAFAWGERPAPYAGPYSVMERRAVLVLFALATAVLAIPALTIVVSGIIARQSSGVYQLGIALYIAALVAGYAFAFRLAPLRTLTGSVALVLGLSVGILSHLLYRNPPATDAIAAFVEHMKVYAKLGAYEGAPFRAIIDALSSAALSALNLRTEPLSVAGGAFRFVELAVQAAILVHAFRKDWRTTGLTALLLATSYTVEIWSLLRGHHLAYAVYFDPWLALAAAMAAKPLLDRHHPAASAALAGGLAVVAALQLSTALRSNFIARDQGQGNACYQAQTYMKRVAYQFERYCLDPAKGGGVSGS